MEQKEILAMTQDELKEELSQMGEKSFRAGQIFHWLHAAKAESFDEMTNLSKALRTALAERFSLTPVSAAACQSSKNGDTSKYLLALPDGKLVEAVRMKYRYGVSLCISSQVGCRMGCAFCASGLLGRERNMTAAEMMREVYTLEKLGGERISHVDIMGTGEPLDNYDEVLRFIRQITDPEAGGISQRAITVSTCGLVPRIQKLAEEKLAVTLAISLHAADNELRRRLMPVSRRYPLEQLIPACDAYFEATGRRVSYEYALMDGVNASGEDAQRLASLLAGKNCHVNLIPVNPVEEKSFRRPTPAQTAAFKKALENAGINVTIRREMGEDIDGACGQLRLRTQS